jgi:hypothetical protein
MAFPRSFKSQTWFVRLSSGEIESATSSALERSFDCGLVHARTQVRAVGTHVWTTLGEAAEIKDGPSGSLSSASSLSPVAMSELDEPAAQTDLDMPWHVRNFGDARAFKSGVGRPLASLVAVAAVSCMLALAMRFSAKAGLDVGTTARSMAQGASEAPADVAPPPTTTPPQKARVMRESEQASPRDAERFAKQEIRHLRELDLQRRLRGDDKPRPGRLTSRTPITPAVPARPSFLRSDPIQTSGSPFDPLNGKL